MADSLGTDPPLVCHVCSKHFGRAEHLKRHISTHTRSREYQCRSCPKAFSRKDALSRHEITHQKSGPNLLQRRGRACFACATSKTRCTGESPCARCQQRSLQCSYPNVNSYPCETTQDFYADTEPRQILYEVEAVAPADVSGSYISGLSARNTETMTPASPHPPGTAQTGLSGSSMSHVTEDAAQTAQSYPNGARGSSDAVMPDFLSTINWLGIDGNNDLDPSMYQEWQYSNQFYDFYLPASDTYSVSQASQSPNTHMHLNEKPNGVQAEPGRIASNASNENMTELAGSHGSASTPGEFYVDSGTARLPRMKKRRLASEYAFNDHNSRTTDFSLRPPMALTSTSPEFEWVDGRAYDDMTLSFTSACLSSQSPFQPFEAVEFPPKFVFDNLCVMYFDKFHSTLPFLHMPTHGYRPPHWLLTLSMAALGSHYVKGIDTNRFVISMHEFVRRVLFHVAESPRLLSLDVLTQFQITLMHSVGTVYCGDRHMKTHGLGLQHELSIYFSHSHLNYMQMSSMTSTGSVDEQWQSWIKNESIRRTKYCAWLIDCLWTFQFQTRSILSLEDATLMLPSSEKAWAASSAEQWTGMMVGLSHPPDLLTALENLYITKTLPPQIGEFSQILLIYGLFRRSWEVEAYYGHRLSHWEPNRQRFSGDSDLPMSPIWLPSLPAFVKWQNSTCDCLDVLHWQANATIGEMSGSEHPTVLHLHLARVVLLAPVSNIVSLAKYLSGQDRTRSEQDVSSDKQAIQRWATQNQYKARLATIHAGVIFWHVRRFSANGFYEPTAVGLAALALWAFSAFSPRINSSAASSRGTPLRSSRGATEVVKDDDSSDSSEDSSCTIILLDRPVDDELVQEFVLNGASMRVNMTGVGDLYGKKGPERVVREGSRILKTLYCWRVWEDWARMLDRLEGVCKRERKRNKVQEPGGISRALTGTIATDNG